MQGRELRQAISICLNCFQTCHLTQAEWDEQNSAINTAWVVLRSHSVALLPSLSSSLSLPVCECEFVNLISKLTHNPGKSSTCTYIMTSTTAITSCLSYCLSLSLSFPFSLSVFMLKHHQKISHWKANTTGKEGKGSEWDVPVYVAAVNWNNFQSRLVPKTRSAAGWSHKLVKWLA